MITYLIIGITVVLSFICFSNRELFMKLAFIPYRTIRNHEYYRIVTHGFIHADMTHLLVNMFTFWSFGLYIERTFRYMGFGKGAYLALYFGGHPSSRFGSIKGFYHAFRRNRFCGFGPS